MYLTAYWIMKIRELVFSVFYISRLKASAICRAREEFERLVIENNIPYYYDPVMIYKALFKASIMNTLLKFNRFFSNRDRIYGKT